MDDFIQSLDNTPNAQPQQAQQPAQQPAPNQQAQPAQQGQPNLPEGFASTQNQPEPQAQPDAANDSGIFEDDKSASQAQQPQAQQPQEQLSADDPYDTQGGVRKVRDDFDTWLDGKYPITGKLDINKIDKKDPAAFAEFFDQMQETSRTDSKNEQAREVAKSEFERQIFEPVYKTFPKLREDKTTDGLVRMLYRGAASENPNVSPVKVAAAFSNFVRQLYVAAQKSATSSVNTIPVAPAGSQGRASSSQLNTDVVDKLAGGSVEDIAKLMQGLQGKGVGGL